MNTPVSVAELDDDETYERRGASGARIIIGKKWTTKLDVERTGTFVRQQGEWLTRYPEVIMLPNVHHVLAHGYVMETLIVPELPQDITPVLQQILYALQKQLWIKPASGLPFDWQTHRAYVHKLLKDVEPDRRMCSILDTTLREFAVIVDFETLSRGQTHGDCIADNVAYREREGSTTGQLNIVLLDPIPASYALPPLRAVDVGRIIQSAIGYESVRYNNRKLLPYSDYEGAVTQVLNWYMLNNFSVNEARACLYFAIIHMLRGIRTTLPGTASRLGLWFLTKKLIEVTQSWMR